MKIRNTRISTQLYAGFAIILVFVLVIGIVSFLQAQQLHGQTEMMYRHPLVVRNALNHLNVDIFTVRVAHRDMLLMEDADIRQENLKQIILSFDDVQSQFAILRNAYLGSMADIDQAYQAFLLWKADVEENCRLISEGNIAQASTNLQPGGVIATLRDQVWEGIKKIDDFSITKADELYQTSLAQNNALNLQLLALVITILALSAYVSYNIIRNIRSPLKKMTAMVKSFHGGDMGVRIQYENTNEFGALSASINALADIVQAHTAMSEQTVQLAEVMLREDDAHVFFRELLKELNHHAGSQVAAVYLLSEEKKEYRHFVSIGMDANARQAFDAGSLEGEFGTAILSGKIQYLKSIPKSTPFSFHVTTGRFTPREIITMPILAGKQIAAVISLAAIDKFVPQTLEWLNSNMVAMSARIEGILAFRKLKALSEQLEQQNRELDFQKSELSAQTLELTQQNVELEMQKRQLDEASRLKTHFLSNMSHELRTPLNSVIALSGVLSRRLLGKIPEEEFGYLEIIERNGKNLLLLINDVLDLSRIESGREEVEFTRFNMHPLLMDVVELLQPLAKQKKLELMCQASEGSLDIQSDMEKCRHILQNIIGNAIKFTERGNVHVSAALNDQQIIIRIADTGIGIPQEHLPHIFDEFRQADSSTSRKYGGSGLGLAIAKKYAELLGGSITVKSAVGEGSEFTVLLPVIFQGQLRAVEESRRDKPQSSQTRLARPAFESEKKTILLVEDNESAIIQIKDFVREMGHDVLVSHDASEALDQIEKTIPDAIILDLMMPGVDGFDLLKIIRNAESTAHIPVLILTAKHITKEELQFLKRNNVHQLIQKGDVDRAKLQDSIVTMLFPKEEEHGEPPAPGRVLEGKPLVLVVEDNPDNMVTARALLGEAYDIVEADSAQKAIEVAKARPPHIILMDIALSGMDGIEAFHTIRRLPGLARIPVIALTASALDHEREQILSHGFDGYISKPIDAKELHKRMQEVLYGKQAAQNPCD